MQPDGLQNSFALRQCLYVPSEMPVIHHAKSNLEGILVLLCRHDEYLVRADELRIKMLVLPGQMAELFLAVVSCTAEREDCEQRRRSALGGESNDSCQNSWPHAS